MARPRGGAKVGWFSGELGQLCGGIYPPTGLFPDLGYGYLKEVATATGSNPFSNKRTPYI